jgi:hypothetical protein
VRRIGKSSAAAQGRQPGGNAMKFRLVKPLLLYLSLSLLLPACASSKATRQWNPGDTVICPHCGREFPLPEKLGK